MFNFCMQPDIKYGSKIYSRFQNDSDESIVYFANPILGVYEDLDGKPLLITSEGGQGKTTSVQLLQAELLCKGVPCYIINCRDIAITDLRTLIPSEIMHKAVLVCDGWDETPNHKLREVVFMLEPFISKLHRVIVTSRYNPATTPEFDEEKRIFCEFNVAEICPFTKEQILELTEHKVSESTRFFDLLSNTMFLSMYLNLTEEKKRDIASTENAYQFVHRYFELLLSQKHQSLTNIDKLFYDVGEQVYLELNNEDSSFASNIGSVSALNNIIVEYEDDKGNWRIDSSHFRYRTFSLAAYLKIILKKWLSSSKSVPEQLSYCYEGNYVEALICLGESLDAAMAERIKSLVDYSSSDCFTRNLLFILLGANHQCFDDEIFGVTDNDIDSELTTDEDLYYDEDYQEAPAIKSFLFNNGYITKVFIHSITKIASQGQNKVLESLYNLRSIEVDSEHPLLYAIDNCLIRKEDNALLLGCYKSVIPQCVTTIKAEAFLNCGRLEHIAIPNSVCEIETLAFAGCYNLQAIDIPDSVLRAGDILMYCQSLKALRIGRGLTEVKFKLTDYSVFGGPDAYNNLEEIVVSCDNPYYYSDGNCLIEKSTGTIVLGCKNSIIPASAKEIGCEAFSCIKTDEIVVPFGIEVIQYAAFAGSTIRRCILPNSVKIIEDKVFSRCNCLELVELPASVNFEDYSPYVFHQATVDMLIVPRDSGIYGDSGVNYHAYFRIHYGDIFARETDGTLTAPPYYDEMKEKATSILQSILETLNPDDSFDEHKKIIRKRVNCLIENNFPRTSSPFETDDKFVITQKAHIHILKVLNDSGCLENFYKKMNL